MSILIIKNISSEGPGTIEDYLLQEGIPYQITDLSKEPIPSTDRFDTLVMMGGPMSVNDENDISYLTAEIKLAERFMKENKKVFGICLGSQIMARALGARVYPEKYKEIGWFDIELVDGGLSDPLMNKLAVHPRAGDYWKKFKVFHWHGETFDMPEGAVRLARSEMFPNQAFRYGKKSYAFQFHIEVRKEMIIEWLKTEPVDLKKLKQDTELYIEDYTGRALNFYKAFFKNNYWQ